MWAVTNICVHMQYARDWMVTMYSYIVVFAEIIFMIMWYYSGHFWGHSIDRGVLDTLYYVLAYTWLSAYSIYAVRTHELAERGSFYAKHHQEMEIKEWRRLLGDIPEPIIFTYQGKVQYCNKATLRLLDLSSASIQTESAAMSTESPEEDQSDSLREKVLDRLDDLKQKGARRSLREIIHDVTALKALEQNKAKEKCFDLLLATVSHDIRTPLNVMLGVIDLLEEYVKTEKGREQISTARSCGQKMLHYLKGLAFIRKINLGSLTISKRLFSPSRLASKVMNNMEISSHLKNLKLELNVDPSVPTTVCSDTDIYSVILMNLIENSIKYTFVGGVSIDLKFDPVASVLTTTVVDTGTGMTEEQLMNVGVLFSEKSSGRCSMNPQGLGVGLFLAKSLPKQLNGELKMESAARHGTKAQFTVACFPLEEASVEQRQLQQLSSDSGSQSPTMVPCSVLPSRDCGCAKILLVDDDPLNLLVLSGYLSSIHVKADKAENGKIALELIEKRSQLDCCRGYSVIFMDINMPVMDGIEATLKIKDMVSKRAIPGPCNIVAVTAAVGLDNPTVYTSYLEKGFTELCNED